MKNFIEKVKAYVGKHVTPKAVKLFADLKQGDKRSKIIYSGCAVVSYGIGMIFTPAGVIAAGLCLLVIGYYWSDD